MLPLFLLVPKKESTNKRTPTEHPSTSIGRLHCTIPHCPDVPAEGNWKTKKNGNVVRRTPLHVIIVSCGAGKKNKSPSRQISTQHWQVESTSCFHCFGWCRQKTKQERTNKHNTSQQNPGQHSCGSISYSRCSKFRQQTATQDKQPTQFASTLVSGFHLIFLLFQRWPQKKWHTYFHGAVYIYIYIICLTWYMYIL